MIKKTKIQTFIMYVLSKEIMAALILSFFGLIPITIGLYNSDRTHQKNIDIQTHATKIVLYASTIKKLDEIGDLYPNILLAFSYTINPELNSSKNEYTHFLLNQFTEAQKNDTELLYCFYSLEPYIVNRNDANYIKMLIKNVTGRSSEVILNLLKTYDQKTKCKVETDCVQDEILESLAISLNKDVSEYSSHIFNYKHEIEICLKNFLFNQDKCSYKYKQTK